MCVCTRAERAMRAVQFQMVHNADYFSSFKTGMPIDTSLLVTTDY